MLMSQSGRPAKLHYMANNFRVLTPGDHVVCAVSGAKNPARPSALLECRQAGGLCLLRTRHEGRARYMMRARRGGWRYAPAALMLLAGSCTPIPAPRTAPPPPHVLPPALAQAGRARGGRLRAAGPLDAGWARAGDGTRRHDGAHPRRQAGATSRGRAVRDRLRPRRRHRARCWRRVTVTAAASVAS